MKTCLLHACLMLSMLGVLLGQAASPAPPARATTTSPSTQPSTASPFNIPSGANVAIIPIKSEIYDFTMTSMARRVDKALAAGATLIVLELDTPGGLLATGLDMAAYIRAKIPVPTIAWVNDQAYSAGILIASSADYIVMSPASATGDCAPIMPGQNLSPAERAKALSPLLTAFRDNAADNNYDYAMFHAMCDLGVEVYLIENPASGQRRLVNQADYAVMVGGQPLATVGGYANAQAAAQAQPSPAPAVTSGTNAAAPSVSLAPPAGSAPAIVGTYLATDADRGQWTLVKMVHDGRTLLTLSQTEATDLGLCKAVVRNDADFKTLLSAGQVFRVETSWSESLADVLTWPITRGLLVLVFLLALFIELQSPGLGLPGAVAGVAAVLLLGAPFLVGLSEWWHIALFLVGFALLLVELFVTPGFGLIGVAGIVCMFVGLALQVIPSSGGFALPPPEMFGRLQQTVLWMLAGALLSMVGAYFVAKSFGRIPLLNRLVLTQTQYAMTGEGAGALNPIVEPVSGSDAVGHGLIGVGDQGRVVSQLRPTGRAEFQGQIVDVISAVGWIDSNRVVKVVEVHGNRIVVDVAES